MMVCHNDDKIDTSDTNEMMGDMDHSCETFESNLSALLQRAYRPPTSRASFRSKLLCTLKERQGEQRRILRARKIRRIVFTASFAAAAVVCIGVWALYEPAQPTTPPIETSSDLTASTATPIHHQIVYPPLAIEPNVSIEDQLAMDDDVSIEEQYLGPTRVNSQANGSLRPVFAGVDVEERTPGPVAMGLNDDRLRLSAIPQVPLLVRNGGVRGDWRVASNQDLLSVRDGMEIRTPAENRNILELDFGTSGKIYLAPATHIRFMNNRLCLDNGEAAVRLGENDRSMLLAVDKYHLDVAPGSLVELQRKTGPQFAPGGEPAPRVTVLRGHVTANGPLVAGVLEAQHIYELDHYVSGDTIPGHKIRLPNRSGAKARFVGFE